MNHESKHIEGSEALGEAYKDSYLQQMLDAQKTAGVEPVALFSDIDHTYQKQGKEEAMHTLTQSLQEEDIPTVAVTGNDYKTVLNRIEQGELPYFQVIAGSVGTEVWVLKKEENSNIYVKDEEFEQSLIHSGYVRTELLPKAFSMIEDIKQNHPEWQFDFQKSDVEKEYLEHPVDDYQKFKISAYFFANNEELEEIIKTVQSYFPDQEIVVCEEIGHNKTLPPDAPLKKYCLDILPITKAGAVKRIAEAVGIKKGLVAGDSGNDVDMLLNTDDSFVAVLVGGAKSEAVRAINEATEDKAGERSFHIVKNNPGKMVYIEKDADRIGPESILHALEVLKRFNSR